MDASPSPRDAADDPPDAGADPVTAAMAPPRPLPAVPPPPRDRRGERMARPERSSRYDDGHGDHSRGRGRGRDDRYEDRDDGRHGDRYGRDGRRGAAAPRRHDYRGEHRSQSRQRPRRRSASPSVRRGRHEERYYRGRGSSRSGSVATRERSPSMRRRLDYNDGDVYGGSGDDDGLGSWPGDGVDSPWRRLPPPTSARDAYGLRGDAYDRAHSPPRDTTTGDRLLEVVISTSAENRYVDPPVREWRVVEALSEGLQRNAGTTALSRLVVSLVRGTKFDPLKSCAFDVSVTVGGDRRDVVRTSDEHMAAFLRAAAARGAPYTIVARLDAVSVMSRTQLAAAAPAAAAGGAGRAAPKLTFYRSKRADELQDPERQLSNLDDKELEGKLRQLAVGGSEVVRMAHPTKQRTALTEVVYKLVLDDVGADVLHKGDDRLELRLVRTDEDKYRVEVTKRGAVVNAKTRALLGTRRGELARLFGYEDAGDAARVMPSLYACACPMCYDRKAADEGAVDAAAVLGAGAGEPVAPVRATTLLLGNPGNFGSRLRTHMREHKQKLKAELDDLAETARATAAPALGAKIAALDRFISKEAADPEGYAWPKIPAGAVDAVSIP